MELTVRELKEEDLEKFQEFWKFQDEEANRFYVHFLVQDPKERARLFLNESSDKIIVLKDNSIIGWGHLTHHPDYPETPSLGIIIKPEFRNQGIGHLIMKRLIQLGKEKKYKGLYLTASKYNLRAIHLYLEFGFKLIEERTDGVVVMRYEY